nr:hypothetical protein [uncultured Microbacterium sp.]
MILLIALLAVSLWAAAATVVEIRRDGYHRIATDWTRVPERKMLDRS